MRVVVGRDSELSALLACVDGLPETGPTVATVVASPGMGKSSLAHAFRDALAGRDVTVLTARPLETEARLAFSTLGELLAPLPVEVYDDLPAPQRRGIRSALLLEDGDGADPRAVAAGMRAVLSAQAAAQPVVMLIDDAHWLDDASAAALGQALSRMDLPVLLVAWARPTGRPLAEWLPRWPRTEIELPPLSIPVLFHVIRSQLDVTLSRSELRAVEQASGGNPLHALEFARHRALGPGASFEGLLADRVLALPRPTRRALLAAALCSAPTVSRLAETLDRPVDDVLDDLEPAVADRLVRVGGKIAFLHPLYLEAVVDSSAPEERVAVHQALAEVEPVPEARVRHRALADDSPDEDLAMALADASDQAWERAAWLSATELLRLSVERSADPVARDERKVRLAVRLEVNGNIQQAEEVLVGLRADPAGPSYWPATIELCRVRTIGEQYDEARALARELDEADLEPVDFARATAVAEIDMLLGREEQLSARVERALARLADVPDRKGLSRLKSDLLVLFAYTRYQQALPFEALLAESIEHDQREPGERMLFRPIMLQGVHQMTSGRFAAARATFDEIFRATVENGDDLSLPVIHSYRASLEVRACRFDEARRRTEEGLAVATGSMPGHVPFLANFLVSIEAHTGDVASALSRSQALRDGDAFGDPSAEALWSVARLGALMEAGRHEEACDLAIRARGIADKLGWKHPADPMIHPNILDALVATGRLDEAEEYAADVRSRAEQIDLHATLAELARVDVAIMAARGDLDAAAAAVPDMLAGLDDLPDGMEVQPVERARALWTAGKVYWRGRARRLAADHLAQAVQLFEELGCAWRAERARADLSRADRSRGDGTRLTPGELAVAQAAAGGLRNTEIAETLFMSTKTVEAHLSSCYRKLGIRSRVDLASALERASHPE